MATFEVLCTGHEAEARKLVLEKKLAPVEKVAVMCRHEIEKLINDNFIVFAAGDDWLCIPKDKADAILKQVSWIDR